MDPQPPNPKADIQPSHWAQLYIVAAIQNCLGVLIVVRIGYKLTNQYFGVEFFQTSYIFQILAPVP